MMGTTRLLQTVLFIFLVGEVLGQHILYERPLNISETTDTIPSGAQLAIQSDKAFRLPSLDSADIYTIANPAEGLMVLGAHDGCLYVHHSGDWRQDCFQNSFDATQAIPSKPYIWTRQNDIPLDVNFSGFSIAVDGIIYYGGGSVTPWQNTFMQYDVYTDTWTQLADIPGLWRSNPAVFSLNKKIYVGAGTNGAFNYLSDFWCYDILSGTWTAIAGLDVARTAPLSFTVNGKGYVGGGGINSGASFTDLWRYDEMQDEWIEMNPLPFTGGATSSSQREYSSFVINDKLYVVPPLSNELWVYDDVMDAWSSRANFPGTTRHSGLGFHLNGQGYVGLGRKQVSSSFVYYTDLWRYDPPANSWSFFGNTPAITEDGQNLTTSDRAEAVNVDETIVFIGGISPQGIILRTVLKYEESLDFIVTSNQYLETSYIDPKKEVDDYHDVLFSATLTAPYIVNTNGPITFESAAIDPTSSFVTGPNSRFIAPTSGYYFFSGNVSFDSGNGSDDTMDFWIMKNGLGAHLHNIINPQYMTRPGVEQISSLSGVLYLEEGDYVQLYITGVNSTNVRADRRVFNGFLLSK